MLRRLQVEDTMLATYTSQCPFDVPECAFLAVAVKLSNVRYHEGIFASNYARVDMVNELALPVRGHMEGNLSAAIEYAFLHIGL